MKQVAFKVYQITAKGSTNEQTGIGYITDDETELIILSTYTKNEQKVPFMKLFSLDQTKFKTFNDWHYGLTTYTIQRADGSVYTQDWHVSYLIKGDTH